MGVLQISAREFREHQKDYFELADKGERIILKRGNKQSYVLTPVADNDLYFTPEMLEKIDLSIQQAKEGKTRVLTPELRDELFGNL